MNQLIAAQPFLGPMAADPSLRGLMRLALDRPAGRRRRPGAALAPCRTPMTRLADALEKLESGQPAFFSWQALIGGGQTRASCARSSWSTRGSTSASWSPARRPATRSAPTPRRWASTPATASRVRLTGDAPLQDEEFGSLADRALPIAIVAVGAIILMLWLAVRSARLIVAHPGHHGDRPGHRRGARAWSIFGTFNVISVAFIPLFVGLGIDFGIQFSVRYRAEHTPGVGSRDGADRRRARAWAGR